MTGKPHLIPASIVAIMLFMAMLPLPYGYYQFLRWVVCGVAIYIAVQAYKWKKVWGTWVFGAIAILFNPLSPIYLTKEIWQPIDVVCALLFGISIFSLHKPLEQVQTFTKRTL